MIEAAGDLVLVLERFPRARAARERRTQYFQRNFNTKLGVLRAPHFAMTASAKFFDERVATKQLATIRGHTGSITVLIMCRVRPLPRPIADRAECLRKRQIRSLEQVARPAVPEVGKDWCRGAGCARYLTRICGMRHQSGASQEPRMLRCRSCAKRIADRCRDRRGCR